MTSEEIRDIDCSMRYVELTLLRELTAQVAELVELVKEIDKERVTQIKRTRYGKD